MKIVFYIAAYVLPAAIVWGILGVVFRLLSNIPWLIPLIALAYTFWFGLLETLGLSFRPIEIGWQVPSRWIDGRPAMVQALIWGTTLGPGLVTRNPYAGIWLLPLLIALNQSLLIAMVVGIAAGIAHGGARVLGVLSNRRSMDMDEEYAHLKILGAQFRWQYIDGLALLVAAGALAAYNLSLLGVHF